MVPDFSIPVNYTTDTGTAVSCSIDLFNMEINYVELTTPEVEYLRAQDWTGVGTHLRRGSGPRGRPSMVGSSHGGVAWGCHVG